MDERIEVDAEGGHRSLLGHAVDKAQAARHKHGPDIGLAEITAMLGDPEVCRYPTRIAFDTEGLEAGMFAAALPDGAVPTAGFTLHVHPHFAGRDADLPLLIAYHLVTVNYGDVADAAVAEHFGATLLGLEVEDYYQRLCALADELEPGPGAAPAGD